MCDELLLKTSVKERPSIPHIGGFRAFSSFKKFVAGCTCMYTIFCIASYNLCLVLSEQSWEKRNSLRLQGAFFFDTNIVYSSAQAAEILINKWLHFPQLSAQFRVPRMPALKKINFP